MNPKDIAMGWLCGSLFGAIIGHLVIGSGFTEGFLITNTGLSIIIYLYTK